MRLRSFVRPAIEPASGPPTLDRTEPVARLHLVPPHEHCWQLRTVEYDDTLEVRRYECETCDDVLFR
ncbi:MAG TPA: hypothetical protein VHO29_01130 [Marmoricola sp.]|nr:hypothetical protein [Marmoricola sp.]